MKENKYDQNSFFEKYAQMGRSKGGLKAAGEWETLRSMLPIFRDKTVLDLGCGYGWHCIYAVEQGAQRVIGVDLSQKMLDVACEQTPMERVDYVCSSIEDFGIEVNTYDVILSSLAFHYVADFATVARSIYMGLKKGGTFVFSVEHPIFTSQGPQQWVCDAQGNILHYPVDRYFEEGQRQAHFLGEDVIKYHRTLTTYLQSLMDQGFRIQSVQEPQPSTEMLASIPGMRDELRRPMMLIISVIKDS